MTQYEQYVFNEDKTIPIFNDNIREDGTIDDTVVETYFCPIEFMAFDKAGEYIRLQADCGATNVELRLTFDELKNMLKQIEEGETQAKVSA